MTPQEQAYIEGFVKRASEYGFSESEAVEILKQAMGEMEMAKKTKIPVPRVPSGIKGNANDVINKPQPIKPLPPEEKF